MGAFRDLKQNTTGMKCSNNELIFVGSINFYQSTINAMIAGRRLALVLQQLVDAGITINLMSHSLGARVVLTALNVLADTHQKAVDHVFLWQPAVADNALSNNTDTDHHPFKAGIFPQAHEAVQKIVVLYSSQDGVLDGHDTPADFFRDLGSGNVSEAFTGTLGGAYSKQWWNIPTAGIRAPLDELYSEYTPLRVVPPMSPRSEDYPSRARYEQELERRQERVDNNRQALALALQLEMQQYLNATDIPEYHLLSPMAIKRIINQDDLNAYIERLWAYYDGEHRESPRTALGYEGFRIIENEDAFIGDNLGDEEGKLFAQVDQSRLLFQHSGMRIPSEELFQKVYVEELWEKYLNKSGFGLYPKEGER